MTPELGVFIERAIFSSLGVDGRIPLRVPLLYSAAGLNRWARSSAAWEMDNRWH